MTDTADVPDAEKPPETSQAPLARRPVPKPDEPLSGGPICVTCIHFLKGKPGFGVCKRYPPEPLKAGGFNPPKLIKETEWCGEHPEIQALVRA